MHRLIVGILMVATCAAMSACSAIGPTHVEPVRALEGIAHLLDAAPATASVNILVVHGMGADTEQNHQDIVDALQLRLKLTAVGNDSPQTLVDDALPRILLGGKQLWSDLPAWQRDAPQLRIRRFHQQGTGKQVNFYLFDYWRALASLKCRLLVASDTYLVGASRAAEYCDEMMHVPAHNQLAARPAALNRHLKTQIVEWGLADAVIASSGFRDVLRKAIQEAMTIEFTDVLEQRATKSGLAVAPHGGDMSGLLKQMRADSPPQFAIITRSLGSYVLFDALAHSTEVALAQVRTKARIETSDLPQVAPASILCFAKQVHMMANQLPLLRLSEIVVDGPSAAPPEVQAFSNCSQLRKEVAETDEAVQVVAYHEPNDLLTFYIDDPEVTGFTFTNVIASFAKIWVPFVVANPTQAHTGQAGKDSIMDILASGYAAGRSDSPDD